MKIAYKSSLQRMMIIYFLLIGFASAVVGTEFIFDAQSPEIHSELMKNFERLSSNQIQRQEAFHPIEKLRNKAILMVTLLLIVVLILLTMFIKNITEPLQHLIDISRLIAAGDLSQTVNIRANNELEDMGKTVNDLTSNLQEMLLLSKDLCDTVDVFVEKVSHELSTQEPNLTADLENQMHLVGTKTKLLKDIILSCKFYKIER